MTELFPTFFPLLWGGLGGFCIELVTFYTDYKREISKTKKISSENYILPCVIHFLIGAIMAFIFSLVGSPILQFILGMTSIGFIKKFE